MSVERAVLGLVAVLLVGCELIGSPGEIRLDVVNRSGVAIVVSVVSDTTGVVFGFRPGEQGSITVPIGAQNNGVGVEILRADDCGFLVEGTQAIPTTGPSTLIVEAGPDPGTWVMTVEQGVAPELLPLAVNPFRCPAG